MGGETLREDWLEGAAQEIVEIGGAKVVAGPVGAVGRDDPLALESFAAKAYVSPLGSMGPIPR